MAQSNLARKPDHDKPAAPDSGRRFQSIAGGGQGSGQPSGNLKAVPKPPSQTPPSESDSTLNSALPESAQKGLKAASPALDLGNLDVKKIGDKLQQGDMKGALGEALTEAGAGKLVGDALMLIWGALFFSTGLIPIIGLFNAIPVLLIFNLLLISPKAVYKITELILDFVGLGEALQALDKAGASKTKITIRGWEKGLIFAMDIGFVIWHFLWIAGIIFSICINVGIGSNLPLIGEAIDLAAKGGDYLTGLPVSETRDICKQITGGSNTSSSNFSGGGAGGSSGGTCAVVNNPASGCDVQKLTGACNWDPKAASQICNQESAGGMNPGIGGTADYCYPFGPNGKKLPMSIGYFQLNIFNSYSPEFAAECGNVLRNEGCWVDLVTLPGTNIRYCPKRKCSFGSGGEAGYNRCVQALSNGDRNTKQACNLYRQRGFQPWSAAKVCKII